MARPRDYSIPIEHMLAAIAGVRMAAASDASEALARDWVRMRAVERGFEIISEASPHLEDDDPSLARWHVNEACL